MKDINDILFTFLWEGTARTKRSVICKDYLDGGLKMINTKAFINALKTTWIRRFCFDKHKWTKIIGNHINTHNFLDYSRLWYRVLNKNIKKKKKKKKKY